MTQLWNANASVRLDRQQLIGLISDLSWIVDQMQTRNEGGKCDLTIARIDAKSEELSGYYLTAAYVVGARRT